MGLTALGCAIGGILYAHGSPGITNTSYWLAIEFGSRWVSSPVAGLLLAELAVCWLGYGQWAGAGQDASPEMISLHVHRLQRLVWFTQLALDVVFLAALASIVSLTAVDHQAFATEPGAQIWGADVYGIFSGLGVIVLTGFGSFAARRLRLATVRFNLRAPDEPLASATP